MLGAGDREVDELGARALHQLGQVGHRAQNREPVHFGAAVRRLGAHESVERESVVRVHRHLSSDCRGHGTGPHDQHVAKVQPLAPERAERGADRDPRGQSATQRCRERSDRAGDFAARKWSRAPHRGHDRDPLEHPYQLLGAAPCAQSDTISPASRLETGVATAPRGRRCGLRHAGGGELEGGRTQ